ncbi:MAG TPA: AAA family ATPase [Acidimicrobiia bacterium]
MTTTGTSAATSAGGTPFVGRDASLRDLRAVLDAARGGRGGLVAVTGAAGIGKTRLVEELCGHPDASGLTLVWTSCALSDESSLHPWSHVVRSVARDDPRVGQILTGSRAGAIPAEPLARTQVFDGIADAIVDASLTRTVLVVVDDLHDAGPSSLQVLVHLLPRLRTSRVLVVATARDDGPWNAKPDVRGLLLRQAHRIPLAPLRDVDIRRLVAAAVGHEDAQVSDAVTVIARRTGGNALLVVEAVRLLERGGEAVATDVPATVSAVVAERTAGFAPSSVALLRVAAVLGISFRSDVLADAAGVALTQVRTALADAELAGVVAFDAPGHGRFTHELVRDAIYDAIAAAERAELHARVAATLALLEQRGRDIGAGEVAHHLLLAGPSHALDGAAAARRAGDRARALSAFEDALHWYERGIAALASTDDPDGRCELLIASGEARMGCGDRAGARRAFGDAATLARALGNPTLLAQAALGVGSDPAGFEVGLLDRDQLDLLEEARIALPPSEPALRSLVAARLSVAATGIDDDAERLALAREAVDVARTSGDPRALAYALSSLCDAQAGPDHCRERLAASAEMIETAGVAHDAALELLGRRLRIVALLELGDVTTADREIVAFRVRAEQFRHPLYDWYVPLWRGMRALMEDRLDECAVANTTAAMLGLRGGSENAALLTATQRWCLLAESGDTDGIAALLADSEDRLAQETWGRVTLALAAAQTGGLEDARLRLDAAAPHVPSLPRDSEWLAVVAQVAEVVSFVGRHPLAGWAYDALLPHRDLWVVEGIGAAVRGPVERHLALLASARDDDAVARVHAAAALACCRSVGATRLVARIEAESARLVGNQAGGDSGEPVDINTFRREGELWLVRFGGSSVHVRDSKGIRDIAVLLAQAGREVAAADLAGAVTQGDTGPALDGQARDAYRRRLRDLEHQIEDARSTGDAGSARRAEDERDALLGQLTSAYGLGGRARRTGSSAQRARTAVTNRIRDAIRRIERIHPELARHLDRSVRTGTFCVYAPEHPTSWEV